ncbi:MAG: S41 family peptidase [Fimbriimonas sp.]
MSLTLTTAMVMTLLTTQDAPTEPRLMRFPSIKGDTVVFTYAGDLWVANVGGGLARRLTSSAGLETRAKISPDGKWVAFTGQYEGNSDVYVVPIEGGEPKRLTFEAEADNVANWTPDGKIAYVSSAGSFTNRQQRLWYVRPEGGLPIRTPIIEAAEASFMPDGQTMVYNRTNSYNFNWRRYRGGTQGRISMYHFPTNKYSELPAARDQNYFPMVAKNAVFYISDKKLGTLNLYKYDLASKRETQLTQFRDSDIKFPSTDGEKIVYERDGYLYTYDIASNQIQRLAPRVVGENLYARPYLRELSDNISSIALSPSGVRVAVEARGELFSVPAKQGDTRNLTETSGARERFVNWSPDGKSLAYVSDATGNYEVYIKPSGGGDAVQITNQGNLAPIGMDYSPDSKKLLVVTEKNELWLIDVAAKTQKLLLKAQYGFGSPEFSPDSKWIALVNAGRNQFATLTLINVDSGEVKQVNEGRYQDSSVSWDLNGKYLYFTSNRSFNPTFGLYEFSLKVQDAQRVYVLPLTKDAPNPLTVPNDEEPVEAPPRPTGPAPAPAGAPIRIDFDGLADRAVVLPMGPGSYSFVTGVNNGVLYYSRGTLAKFDLTSRESTPIGNVAGSISFNPNRTKMAYYIGGTLGVVDVRPGLTIGAGRVEVGNVEAIVNPRDEWKQIFWEAWRFTRDNFYDPNFLGQNWRAIGERYEKYLPYVNHRSDLSYVLGLMVGELGTGHSYVQGGDFGPGPRPIPVGALGADYEVDRGYVRFKRILKGENFEESRRGPLGEPGIDVKDGEYLLEIDGKPVNDRVHPNALLQNKVGRYVTLTVNSTPTMTGARKVRVRPVASEAGLRYNTFVEDNRRYVEKMSNGRIGYMHIPNTATEGAVELIRGFYSQTDKDAVIVDERWNGGGFIQPWFVDTLARRSRAGIQQRNAADALDAVAIEGPKVMLINGYAGSGGDFFPWMFRQSKLGPLVGTRTWGGLVGISGGAPLIDGGSVTAPEFSIYDRETGEIIAENTGVDPDVEVDARPDLVAQGKDPQLDKGIEILLDQLKKMPARKPRTDIPKVGKPGRVGDK